MWQSNGPSMMSQPNVLPRFHHAYDTTHLMLNKYLALNVKYDHLDGYIYILFIHIKF